MNQTTNKTKFNFRDFIICILFSLLSFVVFFFILSYSFFKTPNFDDLFAFFPSLLLLFEGLSIVFFCRRFSKRAIFFTMISSSFVSVLSLLCGFIFGGFHTHSPKIFAMQIIFILSCVLIQILANKKKPKKRKQLPFKK